MNRAPRALASLSLVLLLPAAAASPQTEAAEMTVEFASPGRAVVRTRIPPGHALFGSSTFHALTPSSGAGWQRVPVRFEEDAAGALVFEDGAHVDEAGWVQIPVPLPDLSLGSPGSPAPGSAPTFEARITPPPGYRIVDAFPSVAAAGGANGTVRASLPAPPSFLRFRVVPEDGIAIGLTGLVDAALALLFIGLAAFGARRLLQSSPPAGTSVP